MRIDKDILKKQNAIENLKILGLIWGFLKYYHPIVATGKFNWDKKLIEMLPLIIESDSKVERDKVLESWVKELGDFEICRSITENSNDSVILEPDLDWIENSSLSKELVKILLKVKRAERTGKNHYISFVRNAGNPRFKNEKSYPTKNYPDTKKRILSLFRYWNMVQYFFPYRYLIKEDWKDVLEEFIPKFVNVENRNDYLSAILELITRINDLHAAIYGKDYWLEGIKGSYSAPIDLSYIENKVVITGFYNDKYKNTAVPKIGDVVLEINGKPVEKLIENHLKYSPGSNLLTKIRTALLDIIRTDDKSIEIKIERNNKTSVKIIQCYKCNDLDFSIRYRHTNDDNALTILKSKIAILNNTKLKRNDIPSFWEKISKTKGLIIDCRPCPLEFPVYELCKHLLPTKLPFSRWSEVESKVPGMFKIKSHMYTGRKNKNYYKGKVVLLINEVSTSSAEFQIMAYRLHPNSIVVGSATAGTDGNMSFLTLPGKIVTAFTGIGIYYPDGSETQCIGILPDIEIKPTIKGIREGRDELMEKAIEIIENN
ncbi:MAG: peptidase S41 [Candidatus Delongbacteria bacterium]|nr:peptidase S41 [Candidatus Delongbacteria bacterium]